jgi:hypothetical protein
VAGPRSVWLSMDSAACYDHSPERETKVNATGLHDMDFPWCWSLNFQTCIKKMLPYDDRNVTRRVRRANIIRIHPINTNFLFLYFSIGNPHSYLQQSPVCTHDPLSYPQFKKVFSYFRIYIHTSCAERFRLRNFARLLELQIGISGDFTRNANL